MKPLAMDRYETPPGRRTWLGRISPALSFYQEVFRVIWTTSEDMRNGSGVAERYVEGSRRVLKAAEEAGAQVTFEGLRHLSSVSGPVVIAGNHMSTLETLLLGCAVDPLRRSTFVVKRQLVEYPVFKYVLRAKEPIVVGRANAREDLRTVLKEGLDRLQRGLSVIIFPQPTRSETFAPELFNSSAVKLCRRAEVPLIPLALKTDFWGNGRWLKDVGPIRPERRVRFIFGKPMAVEGNGRGAQEALVAFIAQHLERWRAEEGLAA